MNQTKLQTNLEAWTVALQKAVDFVAKYPQLHEIIHGIYIQPDGVRLLTTEAATADKLGQLFGKKGWTAKLAPYTMPPQYDWKKTVDGVEIILAYMETAPTPVNEKPVAVKDWPIMLEDSKPVIETPDNF